jgi:hypothetical protein
LNRKDEIKRWIYNNTQDGSFVIIDDDKSLNSLPANPKAHLVLTDPIVELTKE